MKKVSLKDIAAATGVSITTVSRVLNRGESHVARDDVVRKILSYAEETGYVPKGGSHGKKGTDQSLGVILGSAREDKYNHSYYSKIYSMIEKRALQNGYGIDFYYTTEEISQVPSIQERVESADVQGVILVDAHDSQYADFFNQFRHKIMVTVLESNYMDCDLVRVNSYDIMHATVDEILRSGRRNPLLVSGSFYLPGGGGFDAIVELMKREHRYSAYMDALAEHGIALTPDRILPCDWDFTVAYNKISRRLESGLDFDFVFAADDLMALGCMKALQEHGVRIPRDVAILGFDDLPSSEISNPPLSTIHVPRTDLAVTAVEILGLRIQGKLTAVLDVNIPAWYEKRGTT